MRMKTSWTPPGKEGDPFFKPDWSPDLALSMPYTGRFTVYRTALIRTLGNPRGDLQTAWHDLLLQTVEHTSAKKNISCIQNSVSPAPAAP